MSCSSVQLAAQPSPPKVLHLMHCAPGQSAVLAHVNPTFGPPSQMPLPMHCDSSVHWAPAFVPPMQVPPLSHSSPESTRPLPQRAVRTVIAPSPPIVSSTGVAPGPSNATLLTTSG